MELKLGIDGPSPHTGVSVASNDVAGGGGLGVATVLPKLFRLVLTVDTRALSIYNIYYL